MHSRYRLTSCLLLSACDTGQTEAAGSADGGDLVPDAANQDTAADAAFRVAAGICPRPEQPLPEGVAVPRVADCAQADLYFAFASGCSACDGGKAILIVANRGTAPASYRVTGNAGSMQSPAPLAPQTGEEVMLPHEFPGGEVRIELVEGTDCTPADNSAEVSVSEVFCAL
jgi:hypothetical protein